MGKLCDAREERRELYALTQPAVLNSIRQINFAYLSAGRALIYCDARRIRYGSILITQLGYYKTISLAKARHVIAIGVHAHLQL